mmetsp:Transcript_27100/g.44416  ORF Transcript_27100/g.44416 Transcript_27100/m.44416 type:complete len:84 (-) Transcript_27100:752-1003(-)
MPLNKMTASLFRRFCFMLLDVHSTLLPLLARFKGLLNKQPRKSGTVTASSQQQVPLCIFVRSTSVFFCAFFGKIITTKVSAIR